MKPAIPLLLLGALALSACAGPRVAVGAGYGIGDVQIGASTSDYGRTVVPSVSVHSGRFYGWSAGPRIPLRGDTPRYRSSKEFEETAPAAPDAPVRARPAPGAVPSTDG